MSTSGDNEIIAKFRDMGVSDRTDMLSKEVAWIPDSNGSSYNGQIVFDLSCFGQTNRWLNYSEAYIQIPYVVSMNSSVYVGATDIVAADLIMKDGFYQIIDSLAVEFNQKTVVQVQNFTNVHTHFKLLTSSSTEDLLKNGPSIGFFGDTVDNLTYANAASQYGIGYINNTTGTSRKAQTTDFDPVVEAATLPTIVAADAISSGRSYFAKTAPADNTRVYYWVVMATIRLSDITDFFARMPVCKTTDVRMIITYNSSRAIVTATDAASPLLSFAYTQLSGHCCPFMIAQGTALRNSTLTIESNVMKTSQVSPVSAITNCRLYVPLYKIADNVSLAMIQSYPTTKFEYNDIYTYVVPDLTANQSFVHTLTTGIVNAQYVVVMPFPKTNALTGSATYQSIFDSAPATTSAITIRDFNVQIAGINVFQSNERYDWEQFMDELSSINAINGNNVLGLTSGVLNMYLFQQGYRMYVCDLRRREPSQDNVIKSIVITGTPSIQSGSIELLCFVAYRKTMSIQTSTGAIVE